jgi:hypothetical protein
MIPVSSVFDQSTLQALLDHDPLVTDYRSFFSLLDWSLVEQWEARQSTHRRPPLHSQSSYLKAFLLRIREGLSSFVHLRRFLLQHPLLILDFGFHLVLDPSAPYGFDPQRSLPCRFWFSQKLRTLDPVLLQGLLGATVSALVHEIPGLGETVAFDVKHIYAWVKENNPRAYVSERYDKTRIPVGDPDCTLGVKRSTNQEQPDGSTKEKKELLWGYGSGVAAATVPDYGDVVLAEYTQPFNQGDATYFEPLYQRVALALGHVPMNITADAAFDAWYVYQKVTPHGGMAAVPKNQHGHATVERDPDGVPLCPVGLRMHPTYRFAHPNGYRAQLYRCPLLFPVAQPGACCEHKQFAKQGCTKHINIEPGGLLRVTLDREGPLYQGVYKQRTSCERINSQAKEVGIERPHLRNRRSVSNLNTLIYIFINTRTLDQAISTNRRLLQML